jgi:hypothetical protein
MPSKKHGTLRKKLAIFGGGCPTMIPAMWPCACPHGRDSSHPVREILPRPPLPPWPPPTEQSVGEEDLVHLSPIAGRSWKAQGPPGLPRWAGTRVDCSAAIGIGRTS